MTPFVESGSLLDDPPKLRRRLREDGYLFFRNLLPRSEVLDLRLRILEICERAGWLRPGSNPMEVGGLKILAGSHKAGLLEPRPAPGTGGRVVDVDQRLTGHQSGYNCGDVLLFKMLTIHASATNLTPDVLRLSADFRYTGTSHVIHDEWFQPHGIATRGVPFTWEVLEKEWRDSPVAHYWERFPYLNTTTDEWFSELGRHG